MISGYPHIDTVRRVDALQHDALVAGRYLVGPSGAAIAGMKDRTLAHGPDFVVAEGVDFRQIDRRDVGRRSLPRPRAAAIGRVIDGCITI